ncbi:AAA family ATPase [Vibrio sp. Vb0937]|uniref:AAA family ATPase n=1 Tax=unclassified Vibrio TaxID=2614977 RepID=UPI0029654BD3|nr:MULTISPECIES: AAA family ATPase [unclassified Vibrio]MDW1824033.1 AAA family ATPase [Vibrio sp. Vb0937]MDW3185450.1 AAA family ATPase [Vibrio sp. Vb0932]
MKLLNFQASSVHGYMDFNINFNTDVNFLIGPNGSGKTTAIKIIKAMLTPSPEFFSQLKFGYCVLEFERNRKQNFIEVRSEGSMLTFLYNNVSEHIPKEHLDKVHQDLIENGRPDIKEFSGDLFERIRRLPTPIFLGVDRKRSLYDEPLLSRQLWAREAWAATTSTRRQKELRNSVLLDAMTETQFMIQEAYKGIRNLEKKQLNVLRDNILKSSFKFVTFEPESLFETNDLPSKASILMRKKTEILRVLHKISDVDTSITEEVNVFFSKLDNLLQDLRDSNDDHGLNFNWLMNQALIGRISDLVEVIDSYDKKIAEIYEPIDRFIDTLNLFFNDSGKSISLDSVGRLFVSLDGSNRKVEVDCLSSGERQILVIVAQVLFNKYGSTLSTKRTIIIIDEPELSLHMRWQEMFSEIILKVSPQTQFILATHSPDIVGELTDKCKQIRIKG